MSEKSKKHISDYWGICGVDMPVSDPYHPTHASVVIYLNWSNNLDFSNIKMVWINLYYIYGSYNLQKVVGIVGLALRRTIDR